MFGLAYKFSAQQYGDDSKQLAEISENMGMIYTELNDFKTALEKYDKALLIRKGINCYSDEYEKTIELIQDLY